MADTLAKKGRDLKRPPRVPDLPKIPLSIVSSKIHRGMIALWKDEWEQNLNTKWRHRQTKLWRPEPCASKAKDLLNNDRLVWSRKVAAMTGHGPFNYHDNLVDPTNGVSAICDRCDSGEVQDAQHIFTRCDAFSDLRRAIFENHEPDDLTQITDHQLGRFIAESNFRWFPNEEEPGDPLEGGPNDPQEGEPEDPG